MSFQVIITQDFDHMSETASALIIEDINRKHQSHSSYVLGLATGNSPTGLYKHLAKAANAGQFDSSRITSFNLDEYIGLPGENAQQRALHKASFSFFMIQEFFGLLQKKFLEANVPWGSLIDQAGLEAALRENPGDFKIQGTDKGKAIAISSDAKSDCLRYVRREILDAYERKIAQYGGIDLHIVGVGGRGHIGFHEAGVPFENNRMLLVKLDDNTIENAVKDGHFLKKEGSPQYAVSMGAELVYQAKTVLLLASGKRKADVVARAMLMEPDCSVPISYSHILSRQGGRMIFVIDRQAAAGVMENADQLRKRGILIDDRSGQGASVTVEELSFSRNPETGLLS